MIHAVVVLDVGCLPGEVMGSIWELNLVPRPYGERPGDSETSCEIMSDSPVIALAPTKPYITCTVVGMAALCFSVRRDSGTCAAIK